MKIAIYCRVSTHHQIDKESLPFQEQDLKNYCECVLGSNNYVVFKDPGYSGKNTERPDFKNMFERIRKNEFTHLLVWKIDRISRNLLDFCSMYNELKQYNCTFISKNEQFDTSSAMGEAMLKIILVFAELERNLTSERVSAIMINRAQEGRWNGANVPIGYYWDASSAFPLIDNAESEIIKSIYNIYEKEQSANRVLDYLVENNIKTKRGGNWTTKTICDVIRNPFYMGTYRYNYRESARGKLKDSSEWIIKENNHQAIISKKQWQKCNDIMDENARTNHSKNRRYNQIHIFRGLLRCNVCGGNMYGAKDRPRKDGFRPSRYRCSNSHKETCNNKIVTDVTLGPFVINYLINFINLINNSKQINSIDDIKSFLLNGIDFKDIDLTEDTLFNIYVSLNINNKLIPLPDTESKDMKVNSEEIKLTREINKFKKALKRLDDLYYFDEKGISEKDYLIKKKDFENKLNDANNKLKSISENEPTNFYDFDFLSSASEFLLQNNIKKHIDFKMFYMTIDNEKIYNFVKSLVKEIFINEDGSIYSITFKNGLVHYFIY